MVASQGELLVPHTAWLFPFTGVPGLLPAELVTPLDTKKGLVFFFLQIRNLSGVDGRLSDRSR